MTAAHFVDTNVLIYAVDSSEPDKQSRAAEWMGWLWRTRNGRLSYQVLSEFYVTVTKKLSRAMSGDEARRLTRSLTAWDPVVIDSRTLEQAWLVQQSASVSWWDALIVAAAQLSDAEILLSEDLPDGQAIGRIRVRNPFTAAVPST